MFLGFLNQLRSVAFVWIFIIVLSKKHVQFVIQESLTEYLLYTKYRVEPDTNVTTLHLLGFHINEEKSSDKIGKQTNNAIKDKAV